MVNFITINTDASFCPFEKVGGYAYWIKGPNLSIKNSGVFKIKLPNSQDAEIKAVANALSSILKLKSLPTADVLIINTDCYGSIEQIKNQSTEISILINDKIEKIKQVTGAKTLILRHVKAHVKIIDKKTYVNDWCDKEAKKHMKGARKNKYVGR